MKRRKKGIRKVVSLVSLLGCLMVFGNVVWAQEARLGLPEGHTDRGNFAIFSPDGKTVLTTSLDNTARIWDSATGKLLQTLDGHTEEVYSAVFSPDGKTVLTLSYDNTACIWDSASGKLLLTFEGHRTMVKSAVFSPNGKTVLTACWDNTVLIWDSASGKVLLPLQAHVNSAVFSPDGKNVLTASGDKTARIWDIALGKIQTLEGHSDWVNSAVFSPDGKNVLTASDDKTARIWDSASGKLLLTLEGHTSEVKSAVFSPDGKNVLTASDDKTARIWDSASGKLLLNLEGHTSEVKSAVFSPDGKTVLTASSDNTARIWNSASGKLLHTLEGLTNTRYVNSAVFSPDGKTVLTSGSDDKTILWDATTGKKLYTRLQLKNGDWLVYDEHYRYDGSPGARDLLYFVCGTEVIELNQVKDALYFPGLVSTITSGNTDALADFPKLKDLDICDAFPIITPIESDLDNYTYHITERNLPMKKVEVFVNDKRIMIIAAEDIPRKEGVFELTLPASKIEQHFIQGQENNVELFGIVKDEGALLRSRGARRIQVAEENKSVAPPKVFGVFVGVKNYTDDRLNLNFTAKDAKDLKNAFELSAQKFLGDTNVVTYLVHNDNNLEPAEYVPIRSQIKNIFSEIGKQAQPQDVVLFFFAGHGEMTGQEDRAFTLLTQEASVLNHVGVSTKDLMEWLSYDGPNKMLANKTILVLDACNSGQATKELIAMARNEDEARRIRQVEDLKDKSGMFIFAASAANQAAYEMPQYQQGLMTYSLLHTLKNDPSVLEDGDLLNLQKWFLSSEKYLGELVSKHDGLQQQAQPFGTANIRIAKVDEEVRSSIQLVGEKVMVMCGNIMNMETFTDDLDLRAKLEQELVSISQRGSSEIAFSPSRIEGALLINIGYVVNGDKIESATLKLLNGKEVVFEKVYKNKDAKSMIQELIADVERNSAK